MLHLPESNIKLSVQIAIPYNDLENYYFKIVGTYPLVAMS